MPLLSPEGRFSLILPRDRFHEAERILKFNNLHLARRTDVSSNPDSKVFRVLSEWTFDEKKTFHSHIQISEKNSNLYHADYLELTKDFYL